MEQAFERILAHFSPLDAVELPVLECLGLALAEDVSSPLNLPPLANSAMDGYAVLHADIAGANDAAPTLAVISAVAAGQVSDQTVTEGNAIRIMTGAPVPAGADTRWFPLKRRTKLIAGGPGVPLDEIEIRKVLPLGSNVRPAGEDVRTGELVLAAGTVIRPAEAGVLASLGLSTVKVIRRPVVAVLSTGDELTTVGEELAPGHIYDSNSSSVAAAVQAAGGETKMIGIARDNLDDLHRCIDAAADADLLVTSAGVSKGDYDMVKDVLEQRGDMNFWSVRMRPAKPLAFGLIRREGRGPLPLLGSAREPRERVAGVRNVRSGGGAPHVGAGPAGAPGGGRRAHRADFQQRRPAGVRAGRSREAGRNLVRHADRAAGLEHPDIAFQGQRPGDLPGRPAAEKRRASRKDHNAGLE